MLSDLDLESATPADFPRWRDQSCTHPEDRLQRDGMGYVCRNCGMLLVAWR